MKTKGLTTAPQSAPTDTDSIERGASFDHQDVRESEAAGGQAASRDMYNIFQ
jgi:hypothetical protein